MKIYYSYKFAKEYRKLPNKIKLKAEKQEQLFRENPHNPQLKSHKLTGKLKSYRSFSIDYNYRVIFEFVDKKITWFHSVGTHKIYK